MSTSPTRRPPGRNPGGSGTDRASTISQVLQANIASGHYKPGDRLPSEADLCAHFQVSRPTLREGLGRLSAVGLIVSRRGSGGGSFVAQPDAGAIAPRLAVLAALMARQDADPMALTAARIQVELGCVHLATQRRADITDLRAEIDQQSDFAVPTEVFAASCQRLHLSICAASGNAALAMMGQALVQAEFSAPNLPGFEVRERARLLSYHVRIANGIAGGRPEDGRAALTELLAYEAERRGAGQAGQAEPERPPRMRDLRLPRVQRLTPGDGS